MDNKYHIRKLIDSMIEYHDILMCGLFKEKSGSNLLKIRFDDLPGGGTRNSNYHFRRKSDKQFDRDITRPSNTKPKTKDSSSDLPSSRTRSKKENLRCDDFSYEYDFKLSLFDGVASPESCNGSDATCKSPDVNHSSMSKWKLVCQASLILTGLILSQKRIAVWILSPYRM